MLARLLSSRAAAVRVRAVAACCSCSLIRWACRRLQALDCLPVCGVGELSFAVALVEVGPFSDQPAQHGQGCRSGGFRLQSQRERRFDAGQVGHVPAPAVNGEVCAQFSGGGVEGGLCFGDVFGELLGLLVERVEHGGGVGGEGVMQCPESGRHFLFGNGSDGVGPFGLGLALVVGGLPRPCRHLPGDPGEFFAG